MSRDGKKLVFELILFIALFLAVAAAALFAAHTLGIRDDLPINSSPARTFVIDAGHGGIDGGASGSGGTVEKDVDLAIAKKLDLLLTLCGERTIMTRTEDNMLSLEGATGNAKGRDIRSRIMIADGTENALLVSIHVNSYPVEKYHGLQVFYSPSDRESADAASAIQNSCARFLQPDNERKIKPAPASIYLLNNVRSSAVLVECGFISNAAEEALLGDPAYQTRLAAVITYGLTNDR